MNIRLVTKELIDKMSENLIHGTKILCTLLGFFFVLFLVS